jgi:hypothetical protein
MAGFAAPAFPFAFVSGSRTEASPSSNAFVKAENFIGTGKSSSEESPWLNLRDAAKEAGWCLSALASRLCVYSGFAGTWRRA